MIIKKLVLVLCCTTAIALSGCSRQQSDWQKARETNTTDSYEQFLKKYPKGEFDAQAQARLKELYEERDWQKARDTDSADAYQAFLKQYPEGKWTEEARIRVENFTLAQAPSGSSAAAAAAEASAPTTEAEASPAAKEQADATRMATGNMGSSAAPKPSKPPAMTKPSAADADVAPLKSEGGRYAVQLGAYKSGAEAAHKRWAALQKEYPSLLVGLKPTVSPRKTASGSVYRLQATGLSEKHARAVCAGLKAKSQECVLVSPTRG